ncbi:NACHT domain-containing protein [Nodosilinea nodulosa]|uniref:NACHT domain-containing protein n=1 Tax=Nodosilinea nodulosa TaxID=416001 RepID=UPI0002D46548|nr:ATP-binding protein [Nodosilinea nodulosa]
MVTSTLRSLIPGQPPVAADLRTLAAVVGPQLTAHRRGLPLVASPREIPMNYRVWGLQFGRQDNQVLTSVGAIADLFQRDGIDGRLLILGEAGVGKTHTLLAVGDLLRQRGGPVPVLLDVSAWAGETMREWLMATLWREYRVAKAAAASWIDTAQLTLLVDGFDHLPVPQQRKFAAALEALLRTNPNQTALLCCRRQVMESSGLIFDQFNGGINIIPLAAQQVKDYVLAQNRPDLWPVIKGSKVLQQLARLPLHLTMLVAMANPAEPPVRNQADLVQRYIDDRLAQAKGNAGQHRATLSWLAGQLDQRPRLFYLDDLQRTWLPEPRQLLYRLLVGLAIALVMGLVGGNLLLGLALGLMFSQIDLENFAYFRLGLAIAPLSRLAAMVLTCGLLALVLGLGLGTLGALLLTPLRLGVPGFGWAGAVGAVLGTGLGLGLLLRGGQAGAMQSRQTPNQDIALALRNTLVLMVGLGALLALLLVLPAMASGQPPLALLPPNRIRLLVGALAIAVLWLSFGLQHGAVRLLLGSRNSLPLAARPWLDAMGAVGLLRRVGGGYGFGHEMLRQAMVKDRA